MKTLPLLAALVALGLPVAAQKMATPAGEAPGPWILGTIGVGKGEDPKTPKTTALKGIAIKVGEHGEAAAAYDLDLCRMAGAWTGKFTTPMNLMSRGEYPTAMGEVAFTTGEIPGFLPGDGTTKDTKSTKEDKAPGSSEPLRDLRALRGFQDPRPEPFGPLPPGQARFKGFYVNGAQTILKWDIGGTEVLERPGFEKRGGIAFVIRDFVFPPSDTPHWLVLGSRPASDTVTREATSGEFVVGERGNEDLVGYDFWESEGGSFGVSIQSHGINQKGERRLADLKMEIPAHKSPLSLRVLIFFSATKIEKTQFETVLRPWAQQPQRSITSMVKGGPARWPATVTTAGEVSAKTDEAYVVDTIKLPDPNPWNVPMFVGGFDFFPDGRAALCTFHGDVFVVSGLDAKLERVTWKRFASGLYHALGLKIVNGEIYVTCRDGLWRLKDLNGDGECDFYEAFNFDLKVTKSFHEFVFDLQTDPAGNFYFAKAGPVKNGGRGFDQIMAHHGALLRVSPDGAKLDVIATGFRAPNGISVGPRGELTSGDNEGTWTPACKINWIKPGGFCGVVDLAHRSPLPTDYDRPLCWLPKRVDNSGGSQVWVPDDERWGPWRGQLLHLSYGQSSLYGVLKEEVGGFVQGGVTKFPLPFQSGIMRARFNPVDGQLYVGGLRGWQTNGLKNGCFQRVRFTGAVPRMPIAMHVKKDGIELRFACSLDTQIAASPDSWHLEQWRYQWSAAYGSPELSTVEAGEAPAEPGRDGAPQFTKAQMSKTQHDSVTVKRVSIGTDDRTVFLEIPGLKPVMQMAIKYDLKTSDGQDLRGEVVSTVHALGAE